MVMNVVMKMRIAVAELEALDVMVHSVFSMVAVADIAVVDSLVAGFLNNGSILPYLKTEVHPRMLPLKDRIDAVMARG